MIEEPSYYGVPLFTKSADSCLICQLPVAQSFHQWLKKKESYRICRRNPERLIGGGGGTPLPVTPPSSLEQVELVGGFPASFLSCPPQSTCLPTLLLLRSSAAVEAGARERHAALLASPAEHRSKENRDQGSKRSLQPQKKMQKAPFFSSLRLSGFPIHFSPFFHSTFQETHRHTG